ncbi:MAG: dethiobiotin synthase [Bdellovibrionales bacterium]|nr:dethiobiotin synthase [Bdellovibrionales bacterium]
MKAASSRAPILFVTGTDTGVGKTAVTAMLARLLSENGRTVHVCKPIETGCRRNEQGELEPTDARVLREAGGGRQSLEQVIHYRFEAPVAPSVAAASVAARIDREALVLHIEQQAIDCDLLLVEGAGGLLVPIVDDYRFLELCRDLRATALVVVGSRLGAINHTLLTLDVLQHGGIEVAGYVVNHPFSAAQDQEALRTNRSALADGARRYRVGELFSVPFAKAQSFTGVLEAGLTAIRPYSRSIIEHLLRARL